MDALAPRGSVQIGLCGMDLHGSINGPKNGRAEYPRLRQLTQKTTEMGNSLNYTMMNDQARICIEACYAEEADERRGVPESRHYS